jgi:cytochrome c oxidase assembly protein subunit 15
MNGAFVPAGLWELSPLWRNFFENELTVQFIHRLGRLSGVCRSPLAHGGIHPSWPWNDPLPPRDGAVRAGHHPGTDRNSHIVTQVPLGWALAHQGWAVVVLGFAVAHWRGFHGAYPLQTEIRVRN